MKVTIQPYNASWPAAFQELKQELEQHLRFLNPIIEHIGSTSVPGLSAKPIIDILVGISHEDDLDKTVQPLIDRGYVFYQKYNREMPYRRFFVKLDDISDDQQPPAIIREHDLIPDYVNDNRVANIHIVETNTYHWLRHIAFRDYLVQHPQVRDGYQNLKTQLSALDWTDFNDYNSGKDSFIKHAEQNAIEWMQHINL